MQETEDIVTPEIAAFMELEKHVSAELYTPEGRAALDLLYTTIATLRAEVEGLRADAERWRAIRQCRKSVQLYVFEDENDPCSGEWSYKNDPEDFDRFADAAIDAAKAGKEGA